MRAVNLLPREMQRASSQRPTGPILVGVLALALASLVLYKMHADADSQIQARQAEIASIDQTTKNPPKWTQSQVNAYQQEGPRITALDSALKTRIPWDNVLRQISLIVPDDVTLQSLTLTAPVAADATVAATTGASGVTITGSSYSQDGVARFLARLEVVPSLKNVQLASSTMPASTTSSTGESTSIVTFTITADVVTPAVVS
jgi:Tfp pilus assembly protein PilN